MLTCKVQTIEAVRLTNQELAKGLSESPSQTYRALQTLIAEGLVRKDENDLYTLGTALVQMANDTVRFTNNINSILEAVNEHDLYAIQDRLEANVVALFQQIAQTSVALGIQIDFEAMVNPDWMQSASTPESEA